MVQMNSRFNHPEELIDVQPNVNWIYIRNYAPDGRAADTNLLNRRTKMSMNSNDLNGSVDMLANAMRRVFSEAVEGAVRPVHDRLDSIEGRIGSIDGRIGSIEERMATKDDLDTMNRNVQSQLAQHREDVRNDVKRIIAGR